ncbi:MAG: class I SAM-dependent methyltransferase [Planctomycetota bacterium]|jgi:SAM-dependent methyltransferase
MEVIQGNIYDYPKYYDVLFGSDCQAEYSFLRACFNRHARCEVRRLFEPACGTGRLLFKLAKAGYEVSGNDLNPKAVQYCNARFTRNGLAPAAVVGDMADFRVRRKQHAAFNTINSFRHLDSERKAEGHLRCIAGALAKGGIYVLGLHLTPTQGIPCDRESWSARRGHLGIVSEMWSIEVDRRRRQERVGFTLDVHTPTRQFRLADELLFRTYTVRQFHRLLGRVPELELVETYDFGYRIRKPVCVGPESEDVVFVLRKK